MLWDPVPSVYVCYYDHFVMYSFAKVLYILWRWNMQEGNTFKLIFFTLFIQFLIICFLFQCSVRYTVQSSIFQIDLNTNREKGTMLNFTTTYSYLKDFVRKYSYSSIKHSWINLHSCLPRFRWYIRFRFGYLVTSSTNRQFPSTFINRTAVIHHVHHLIHL